jgi:hypothetical protein
MVCTLLGMYLLPPFHLRRSCLQFRLVSSFLKRTAPPQAGKADELFFAPLSRSRHIMAYLAAATQIIFWGNLSHWAATGYAKKNECLLPMCSLIDRKTGEYELAGPTRRYVYAGWLLGLGIALACAFLFVPSRSGI